MEQELIGLREAAEYAKLGWATLYMATRNRRLWHERVGNRIYTTIKAVDDYRVSRHAGELRQRDGVSIYGPDKWTVGQTAKFIAAVTCRKCQYHNVMLLIRARKLPAYRDGRWYVVLKKDAVAYCEDLVDARHQPKLLTYK